VNGWQEIWTGSKVRWGGGGWKISRRLAEMER
jgi:hypothetical protein